MSFSKNHRQETLVYIVLWGLIFIAPVMTLYIRTHSGQSFEWNEVFMVWREYGLIFAVFLVHNYLMAPLLVYKQRKKLYFTIAAALVALFSLYQCTTGPSHRLHHGPPHEIMDDRRQPAFEGKMPPPMPKGERPPLPFNPHDLTAVVMLVLMLFANLGIKLYFKQRRDQLQMAELEKQNLQQQLEYLKYQLNPHFLMNTLNNIHALVDIDPERSKEAIIQLSKILRYVLYESNHERVPMSKEQEFMENYTQLMRMRYGSKLRFNVSLAENTTNVTVPPLLFISFVENAFKHGVSYQQESFIDIMGKRYTGKRNEARLLWTCKNSKHPKPETSTTPPQGGIGMANIRQRLDLIYGNNYALNTNETDDIYEVILDIPLETMEGE